MMTELEAEYDKDLFEIEETATPGNTGWYEITINGKLIHSKKNGDGYVDTEAKFQKISDAVAAALKEG